MSNVINQMTTNVNLLKGMNINSVVDTVHDEVVIDVSETMTREEAITALGDRNNLLWGMSKEEKKHYSEALDMAISALKSGWIPVSERLPEKSGDYWCTFGGSNLTGSDHYTTESDAEELFDDPEEYTGWRSQNVIAWQPLPKPYKKGE